MLLKFKQLLGSHGATEEDWTACCPRFEADSLDDFEASAGYADALFCLQEANCNNEHHYFELQAECAERCCHNATCRYPPGHRDAGELKEAYASTRYTMGGPCEPSTPPIQVTD